MAALGDGVTGFESGGELSLISRQTAKGPCEYGVLPAHPSPNSGWPELRTGCVAGQGRLTGRQASRH
ncbi:hypothetical protein [Agrobacterium sp. DSM 25558]|uniref:hypothetical protein n=1 Tax=Agrobacterium sp. DSM 25558 TaxID=1907665 RepID=UPI00352F0B23